MGNGKTSPPTRSSPWLQTVKSPNSLTWRLYGSRGFLVKVTPEPDSRPRFPNTIFCTTTAVPDFNRGYVERYAHYEPPTAAAEQLIPASQLTARRVAGDGPAAPAAVRVTRADLDDALRDKRAACATCRYDAVCEGVWRNYLKRHGWDEFVPVPGA